MKSKTITTMLILAFLLLSLVSILINVPKLSAQLALPPGVKREETLILDVQVSSIANPDNFNSWVIGAQATMVGINQVCFSTLYYTDYKTGVTMPWLADGYPQYSSDYTMLTIKIVKGVYWSNGDPFTAWDVVYAINVSKANNKLSAYATLNTWVDSAWVVDDYTLVIKLKKPNPYFHYLVFTIIGPGIYNYMMPMRYFQKIGVNETNIHANLYNPPVCIGPYVLHSYDPGGTWFLWKRRDDWNRSSIMPLYKQKIILWPGPKYVMFRVFKTETDKVLAMSRGELDWIFDATWQAWESLRRVLGDRVQAWLPYYPYFWGYDTTVRGIYFNNMKYPYNITQVRWALALAINMTEVMTVGYKGVQRMTVIPGAAGYPAAAFLAFDLLFDDLLNFEITLPNGTKMKVFDSSIPFRVYNWARSTGLLTRNLTTPEILWVWGIGWWRYAPDAAEQILRSLGFKRGSDGKWLLPNGQPWKMKLNVPSGFEYDAIDLGLAVAEQWRKFGIDVEVVPLESASFWTPQLNYGAFEVGSYWGISGNDPNAMPIHFDSWRCDYVKPIGNYSSNGARYCNPKFDEALLKALNSPPGSSEARMYLKEAILTMLKDMPVIWTGDCKKLLPVLTDYWTNWPNAYNFYAGLKLWGNQYAQIVIGNLIPVKSSIDTPTSRPVNEPPPGTITFPTVPEEALKKILGAPGVTTSPATQPRTTTTPPTTSPTIQTPTQTAAMPAATITATVEKSVTIPTTATIMSTVLSTTVSTTPTTITVTEWTTTTVIAIALLAIGIAIGWTIKRK
ncbi:MAG: ABC transporter substrate-binding protein [Ignisphaera sp.]